jgi:chemotaxis protein MotD
MLLDTPAADARPARSERTDSTRPPRERADDAGMDRPPDAPPSDTAPADRSNNDAAEAEPEPTEAAGETASNTVAEQSDSQGAGTVNTADATALAENTLATTQPAPVAPVIAAVTEQTAVATTGTESEALTAIPTVESPSTAPAAAPQTETPETATAETAGKPHQAQADKAAPEKAAAGNTPALPVQDQSKASDGKDQNEFKQAHAQPAQTQADKAEKPTRPATDKSGPALDTANMQADNNAAPAPDAAQPLTHASAHNQTQAASSTQPASQSQQAAAVPVAGLAIEIATQARAGKNRFEIRLDPPELGRIDVRLDVDRDGNVTSRLVVDRVETLDLLRRDAQQIERALNQAGLKTSDNALQFSLRDQGAQQQNAQDENGRKTAQLVVSDDDLAAAEVARGYGRLLGRAGGLDIRV